MRHRWTASLWVMLLAAGPCLAGAVEVSVGIPLPQKVDTTGMRRLLVAAFRAGDHPQIDLDRETVRELRGLFRKRSPFEVLEVDPLPLPEQPIEDAIRNTAYWKRLAARFNADLLIGGTVEYSAHDISGFVQEDVISPMTGQRMRRSRWAERESFKLDLGLYYFRGSSGELLYEDHFSEELAFDGKANDDLTVLHQIMERLGDGIVGVVVPVERVETRYLLTE